MTMMMKINTFNLVNDLKWFTWRKKWKCFRCCFECVYGIFWRKREVMNLMKVARLTFYLNICIFFVRIFSSMNKKTIIFAAFFIIFVFLLLSFHHLLYDLIFSCCCHTQKTVFLFISHSVFVHRTVCFFIFRHAYFAILEKIK